MCEPSSLRQFFEPSHIVRTLHFHFKSQHQVFNHGIVEFPDMRISVFFKMEIRPETQSARILNTHAILITDDFLGDADADRRSYPRLAVYLQKTVQASGKALHNGKPQSQAVRRPGSSRIRLIKAFKYLFQLYVGHPYSGIRDFDKQINSVLPLLRREMYIHAALIRILECVVYQMTDDLLQLRNIRTHGGRNAWIHIYDQFQILPFQRRKLRYNIMQQGCDHIILFVYRKRSHIHLGIVQNIADLVSDLLAGLHDRHKVFLRFSVFDLVDAYSRKSDYSIDRRADLVGNIREKVIQPVRCLRHHLFFFFRLVHNADPLSDNISGNETYDADNDKMKYRPGNQQTVKALSHAVHGNQVIQHRQIIRTLG